MRATTCFGPRRCETEGGGEDDAAGGLPAHDYFCTMRGEEGMEAIAGPALDSEEALGESDRRARVSACVSQAGHARPPHPPTDQPVCISRSACRRVVAAQSPPHHLRVVMTCDS